MLTRIQNLYHNFLFQAVNYLSPLPPRATLPTISTVTQNKNIFTGFSTDAPNKSAGPEISPDHHLPTPYSPEETFKKGIKIYSLIVLEHLIPFIKKYINPKFHKDYNKDMDTWSLLEMNAELQALILTHSPQISDLHRRFIRTTLSRAIENTFSTKIEELGGNDNVDNIIFSYSTHREISLKYYEFNDERNQISKLNLNPSTNQPIIPNFDSLTNSAIDELQETIYDKYYSLFRILVSSKKTLHEKTQIFLPYIGIDTHTNNLAISNDYCFSKISNAACYTAKLQIFIDLLTRLQQSPKTTSNLKIVLAELDKCIAYFDEDKAFYRKLQNSHTSDTQIPIIKDYYEVKNKLKFLKNSFSKLLPQPSQALDDWIPDITKKFIASPKKNSGKKVPETLQNSFAKPTTSIPQIQTNETSTQNPQPPVIQIPSVETESLQIPINTLETNTAPNPSFKPPLPTPVSEIPVQPTTKENETEQEENELYESILRLFDKDREKKLKLKKLKSGLIDEKELIAKPTESKAPKKQITCVNIKVGNQELTFQKLEKSTFLNDVWGVIITDSIDQQILSRYKQLLANGTIGSGSISQLTSFSDIYEIGSSTMDSRLLGKKYDNRILDALLKFLSAEDELQLNQELEIHGINDQASLIIFSAEAKKHQQINSVAKKLSE